MNKNYFDALKLSLIYGTVSLIWIFGSNAVVSELMNRYPGFIWISAVNVVFFVFASSGILFFLINRELSVRKKWELELKKINDKLVMANEELKSLDELKNNIISNVSHELRTPLVAIRGYIEIILSGKSGRLTDAQDRQLSIAIKNIERLVEIIENMLSVSRLHSGIEKFDFNIYDLRTIVKEACEIGKKYCAEKNIELKLCMTDQILIVKVDKLKIFQSLKNIIDNSIKFTEKKGKINVSASLSEKEGFAEIAVEDTGIGIKEKDLDKIFDNFFQGDSSTKKKYGGSGIGLNICKEIIKQHNGTISASSIFGQGTKIIITLPLNKYVLNYH